MFLFYLGLAGTVMIGIGNTSFIAMGCLLNYSISQLRPYWNDDVPDQSLIYPLRWLRRNQVLAGQRLVMINLAYIPVLLSLIIIGVNGQSSLDEVANLVTSVFAMVIMAEIMRRLTSTPKKNGRRSHSSPNQPVE